MLQRRITIVWLGVLVSCAGGARRMAANESTAVGDPVADAGRDDTDVFAGDVDDTSHHVKPRAVANRLPRAKALPARACSEAPSDVPEETRFRFTPFKGTSPRAVRSRSISDQATWLLISPRGIATSAPS
jgi:hypothetical protein